MLANFGPGIWSRVSGVGPGFYSFPLLSSVFYENQYLSAGREDFSSGKNNIPCTFLLYMERNPNPAMNLRMMGKNLQAWWSFDTICFDDIENKPEVKPIEWPIFRVMPLIFLRLFSLLIHIFCSMPVVCLFNIFLLLFSNKWKVRFCFIVARNNLTSHTAKYRMNDVTMIYRIVLHILI